MDIQQRNIRECGGIFFCIQVEQLRPQPSEGSSGQPAGETGADGVPLSLRSESGAVEREAEGRDGRGI